MKHTLQTTMFRTGCILAAFAVILGAFGAHVLKSILTEQQLQSYEAGVRYHVMHVLAILLGALYAGKLPDRVLRVAYRLFFTGIILFSGSIYLLTTGPALLNMSFKWLGPVTPLGGLCFISGWLWLAWHAKKIGGIQVE
ncbi:MAG: DUF423 domain-containing protein [Bacteroidia bacterium]|jgi:uncharacterized membrane protein YgdD (TMEM256/DUF423 family)